MKRCAFLTAIAVVLSVAVSALVMRRGRDGLAASPETSTVFAAARTEEVSLEEGTGASERATDAEGRSREAREATVATAEMREETLKQTSWWTDVQENIRRSEYNITYQEKSVLEGEPGGLHAANRDQNLRAYFRNDGVQILQRSSQVCPEVSKQTVQEAGTDASEVHAPKSSKKGREDFVPRWEWTWQLAAWGRKDLLANVPVAEPSHDKNQVQYSYGAITEWYKNTEDGIEQGLSITERPSGDGDLIVEGAIGGDLRGGLHMSGEFIQFLDAGNAEVLRYSDLKATDARGEELPARMHFAKNILRLEIDDTNAMYPVTIDPILTTPGWIALGDQNEAYFGCSVSGGGGRERRRLRRCNRGGVRV